jgi:hypothetical protein
MLLLGDVLVILDLHSDDSLFEAGFAREVLIYSCLFSDRITKLSFWRCPVKIEIFPSWFVS